MAAYTGLVSVASHIMAESKENQETIQVRRGHFYHNVVVPRSPSVAPSEHHVELATYLETVMANDDVDRMKRLMDSDTHQALTTQLSPYHMAAAVGFLQILSLLFKSAEDATRKDEEKRIPLHMAALGGSMDAVRQAGERMMIPSSSC